MVSVRPAVITLEQALVVELSVVEDAILQDVERDKFFSSMVLARTAEPTLSVNPTREYVDQWYATREKDFSQMVAVLHVETLPEETEVRRKTNIPNALLTNVSVIKFFRRMVLADTVAHTRELMPPEEGATCQSVLIEDRSLSKMPPSNNARSTLEQHQTAEIVPLTHVH